MPPPPAVAPPPPPQAAAIEVPRVTVSAEDAEDDEGMLPNQTIADDSIDFDTTYHPDLDEEDDNLDESLSATFLEQEAMQRARDAEAAEAAAQEALERAAQAEAEAKRSQEAAGKLQKEIADIEQTGADEESATHVDDTNMSAVFDDHAPLGPPSRSMPGRTHSQTSEYETPPSSRHPSQDLLQCQIPVTVSIKEVINAKYLAAMVSKCKTQPEYECGVNCH